GLRQDQTDLFDTAEKPIYKIVLSWEICFIWKSKKGEVFSLVCKLNITTYYHYCTNIKPKSSLLVAKF
ncbi:hypothetical protein, partial [Methanobacterium sp. 42_16]|uniref:hypothetical protein n=1 Tax=Methanobacterium sp. 42_16 TaxID=1641383 RepID=UPI002579CE89